MQHRQARFVRFRGTGTGSKEGGEERERFARACTFVVKAVWVSTTAAALSLALGACRGAPSSESEEEEPTPTAAGSDAAPRTRAPTVDAGRDSSAPSASSSPSSVPAKRGEQPADWNAGVSIPSADDKNPDSKVVEIDLEARLAKIEVRPGVMTEVWTYNGSLPGPTVHAKKGDKLLVHFTNHLPEPTTIHWHGLRVPAAMDGSDAAQKAVRPGETFDYAFDLLDSGTYWYHPHIHSSAQVGYGLYGAIIVDDPAEPWLGDDLPLVLSDMGVNEDGTLAPGDESGAFGDYFGREGGVLLVNGRKLPRIKGRVGVPQRWRIVNAARSRYQRFSIPGQAMVQIGSDGGLIERPLPVETITLAPGERVELYLLPRAQTAGAVTVKWEDAGRFGANIITPPQDFFTFEVVDDAAQPAAPPLPEQLRRIDPAAVQDATELQIALTEKTIDRKTILGINGKTAAESEPVHARVGTTQVWELSNTTRYDHPFHLHGFPFQILDIDGQPPSVRAWRDTVNLHANQRVRIAIPFDNRPGMWMFHCHILDHADLGMMGMLMVM